MADLYKVLLKSGNSYTYATEKVITQEQKIVEGQSVTVQKEEIKDIERSNVTDLNTACKELIKKNLYINVIPVKVGELDATTSISGLNS